MFYMLWYIIICWEISIELKDYRYILEGQMLNSALLDEYNYDLKKLSLLYGFL